MHPEMGWAQPGVLADLPYSQLSFPLPLQGDGERL